VLLKQGTADAAAGCLYQAARSQSAVGTAKWHCSRASLTNHPSLWGCTKSHRLGPSSLQACSSLQPIVGIRLLAAHPRAVQAVNYVPRCRGCISMLLCKCWGRQPPSWYLCLRVCNIMCHVVVFLVSVMQKRVCILQRVFGERACWCCRCA
jgi:hypothetical protein